MSTADGAVSAALEGDLLLLICYLKHAVPSQVLAHRNLDSRILSIYLKSESFKVARVLQSVSTAVDFYGFMSVGFSLSPVAFNPVFHSLLQPLLANRKLSHLLFPPPPSPCSTLKHTRMWCSDVSHIRVTFF